jgi:hypothetical protein
MKKRHFLFLFFVSILSCVNTPVQNQDIQENVSKTNQKIFLSNIEYYFNFIGKNVPSHFRPIKAGSNVYEPLDDHPTLGREILSLGVKNEIVEKVFVFCIFDNRNDYGEWFWNYLTEAEKLGFIHGINDETNIIFFIKNEFTFVFIDKESENPRLPSGQFEFWKS